MPTGPQLPCEIWNLPDWRRIHVCVCMCVFVRIDRKLTLCHLFQQVICKWEWSSPLGHHWGFWGAGFYWGGVNLTPPSDLGPEGADRREILHECQDTCKEYCYNLFLAENCLFIMLLWFMQIRCIINCTYLLIFPTNRISEGQFLAESYVEAL